MKANTTRLFRQAVRAAACTIKRVAQESGYAAPTFDKYLNERPPTGASVAALADAPALRGLPVDAAWRNPTLARAPALGGER